MLNFFHNLKSYFVIIALLFNAWVTPSDHQNASQAAKNDAQIAWFYEMLQDEPLERRSLAIKEEMARTDLCIHESCAEESLLFEQKYTLYEKELRLATTRFDRTIDQEELKRGFLAIEEQMAFMDLFIERKDNKSFEQKYTLYEKELRLIIARLNGTIDNQESLQRQLLAIEEQKALKDLDIERKEIERSWLFKQNEALVKEEGLLSGIRLLYEQEAFARDLLTQEEWMGRNDLKETKRLEYIRSETASQNSLLSRASTKCFRNSQAAPAARSH